MFYFYLNIGCQLILLSTAFAVVLSHRPPESFAPTEQSKNDFEPIICKYNDNLKCGRNSVCVNDKCKCIVGYHFDFRECEKLVCFKNEDCKQFSDTVCIESTCQCKAGYMHNDNTATCIKGYPPGPSGGSGVGVGVTVATSVGSGIVSAVVIIAIWRYIRRRRSAHLAKTGFTNLPFGSYPVSNATLSGASVQQNPPPPPFPPSTNYYPGPVISRPTTLYPVGPAGTAPVSYHHNPHQPAQQQYGSASTSNMEFPPPYSPVDLVGCSSSMEPDASVVNSSHLTVGDTSPNRYSPLSSSKLALL